MKKLNLSLLTLMAALLLPLGAQAQEDDLEVTLEAVPADSSADAAINNIELPQDADPQAHKNAEFGIGTANKARRLREEMSHEFGSEVSDAARERARERTQNIQVPGERP
ncbi:MAG: hypothetical protein RI563_12670 [Thiohalophilus sp.]|uniref:hypothetical protein n=1 Tax=Thiohalophilus sp. TaxID=3028392 RepID=UPI00286FDB33|nr:hypothetical protein [Thiohalophilus sp.]MDR9437727.1 hypothetical protein [Thiohalophilus sp.]